MMDKPKEGKRYPLEHKPLRNPGESIQAEMDRLLHEEILSYAAAAFYMVLFTIFEWIRWFFHIPPQPIAITIATLLAIGYTGYRFVVIRKQYKALQLGWGGEKFVGQYLETLRSFIEHEPEQLKTEDVALISSRLVTYMQTVE